MTDAPLQGRWVLDTNVLISTLLKPRAIPAQAFACALAGRGKLLVSQLTLAELGDVLFRPKFDRYISTRTRQQFLVDLMPVLELVPPSIPIRACRDPRDDKFLEVAVHGSADAIVTGDADLPALNPFHGVPILAPCDFVAKFASPKYSGVEPGPAGLLQEPRPRYRTRKTIDAPAVKA